MIFWTRKSFLILTSGLVLGFLIPIAYGASTNFVRVPISNGASIEVPKNWIVLSENKRITLATAVEAITNSGGRFAVDFAANLYDENNKNLALVHIQPSSRTNLTQRQVKQLTSANLRELDTAARSIEAKINAHGMRIHNWYDHNVQIINGLYVIVNGYQFSGAGVMGAKNNREIYVGNGSRSFRVVFSYQESDKATLLPIINYMTSSIRQE